MWSQSGEKVGFFAAVDRVIEVVLEGPLANFCNFRIVDLDFINGVCRLRGQDKNDRSNTETSHPTGDHIQNYSPDVVGRHPIEPYAQDKTK